MQLDDGMELGINLLPADFEDDTVQQDEAGTGPDDDLGSWWLVLVKQVAGDLKEAREDFNEQVVIET